jgi:uncharacterized protein YecT (DUF1311 family)
MRLHRFLATGCGAAALALSFIAPASAGAASSASAPVVHEQFTLLACPSKPSTTVQIEGCAEHKVIALDTKIDALNATIFSKLTKAGRPEFIATNSDWVKYRNQACTAEASVYSGGTIQPIVYANCLIAIDGTHLTELKAMLLSLSPEG